MSPGECLLKERHACAPQRFTATPHDATPLKLAPQVAGPIGAGTLAPWEIRPPPASSRRLPVMGSSTVASSRPGFQTVTIHPEWEPLLSFSGRVMTPVCIEAY